MSNKSKSLQAVEANAGCESGLDSFDLYLEYSKTMKKLQTELKKKFVKRKNESQSLAIIYITMQLQSRFERVYHCGDYLEFKVNKESKKLSYAQFCKDRLCPMCNWRRSLKIFGQISQIIDVIKKDYQFIFLTLTVKNCNSDELSNTINSIYSGWRNLYHENKVFKTNVKGTFRALEITKNSKTGLYHPHLHVILSVNKSYFSGKTYLTNKQWSELWKNALNVDYMPIIDVRKIKDNGKGISGAVAEVSKYAVKSKDIITEDLDESIHNVSCLLSTLSNRRLCSFTGVFAKVRKQLKLDDIEKGNLINTNDQQLNDQVNYIVVKLSWRFGYYEIV